MSKISYNHTGHIHLSLETIFVLEVVLKLTERPDNISKHERECSFRQPDDDKLYSAELLTLEGEVVATGKNVSYDVWKACNVGHIKHMDTLAIELEEEALVLPERPKGDRWVAIFGEAMCNMYTRVKFDNNNKVNLHMSDNIVRIGDDNYHRKW